MQQKIKNWQKTPIEQWSPNTRARCARSNGLGLQRIEQSLRNWTSLRPRLQTRKLSLQNLWSKVSCQRMPFRNRYIQCHNVANCSTTMWSLRHYLLSAQRPYWEIRMFHQKTVQRNSMKYGIWNLCNYLNYSYFIENFEWPYSFTAELFTKPWIPICCSLLTKIRVFTLLRCPFSSHVFIMLINFLIRSTTPLFLILNIVRVEHLGRVGSNSASYS
jgi:hypothetical protein